jgi:hypothetical protein
MIVSLIALLALSAERPLADDFYMLPCRVGEIRLKITGSLDETKAFVMAPGTRGWQPLNIPTDCNTINRNEFQYPGEWSRPEAGCFAGSSPPTLWINCYDGGVDIESSVLILFQLHNGHFDRMPMAWAKTPTFSDKGAFYSVGRSILIWDPDWDEAVCTQCPHRYILKVYRLVGPNLKLVSSRETRKDYDPSEHFNEKVSQYIPPKDDPLTEFGMRWRWWGPRKKSRRLR